MQFTIAGIAEVLCLLLFVLAISASAQEGSLDRPLVASGSFPMSQEDMAEARNLALEEALRGAVEQSAGLLLPVKRIVRFYPLVLERILAEPMPYVKDYQIIHEGVWSGLYRVTVQTTVSTRNLRRDLHRLGLFLAESERPRVVILVAEQPHPQDSWQWWWRLPAADGQECVFSRSLMQVFAARGLVPLDPDVLVNKVPQEPIYQEPLLADAHGTALARALGAQVVVLGQVKYQPASSRGPATASASLRALKASSRELLAQTTATVRVHPSSEQQSPVHGFTALAERVGPELADKVLAPFTAVSLPPTEITVQVRGLRHYADLVTVKKYLQDAPGVVRLSQIMLQADLGSFSLLLAGSPGSLCSSLSGHDFGAFSTSARLTSDTVVSVRIVNKR